MDGEAAAARKLLAAVEAKKGVKPFVASAAVGTLKNPGNKPAASAAQGPQKGKSEEEGFGGGSRPSQAWFQQLGQAEQLRKVISGHALPSWGAIAPAAILSLPACASSSCLCRHCN